ncbi:MAG: hypothetical protein Q8862_11755 [Bacteroidota bacterium]|nr:hypothetical protein [Bacteroidota bacterium]MDP4205620.1 hypothetical protein [Bacteroidota bacterium]
MKTNLVFVFFLLVGLSTFGQNDYTAEKYQTALMPTKTGGMIAYTGTSHSFTLNLVSNNIKPLEHHLINIDNTIFQSIIIPFKKKCDFEHMSIEDQKANLLGYMNYELDYVSKELKLDVRNKKYEWLELNGKQFLFWYYDMPDSNPQIEKQIFLTTVCYDQFLCLGSPLGKNKNGFEFNKALLVKIGKTLQMNNKPIDLNELQKELKNKL